MRWRRTPTRNVSFPGLPPTGEAAPGYSPKYVLRGSALLTLAVGGQAWPVLWNSLLPNTPVMWVERRKHELWSQRLGPSVCSAIYQAGWIVLTPLRKISFSLFVQWLEHNLPHRFIEEVTWHLWAFDNPGTVQVLGELDILFASLRMDVRFSIGRTLFVGWWKKQRLEGGKLGNFRQNQWWQKWKAHILWGESKKGEHSWFLQLH